MLVKALLALSFLHTLGIGYESYQLVAERSSESELARQLEVYAIHHENIEAFNVYFVRSTSEKIIAWEEAGCPAVIENGQATADKMTRAALMFSRMYPENGR